VYWLLRIESFSFLCFMKAKIRKSQALAAAQRILTFYALYKAKMRQLRVLAAAHRIF
jgi:hypothetical protein